MNIGFVVCGIIFVYVLFHLLSYYTTKNVTIYEVKSGTIVSDHQYRAFAVREESVINTDAGGFIYYFVGTKNRVGVKSQVYCIDESGSIIASLTSGAKDGKTKLSEKALASTLHTISSFTNTYSNLDYQKTYTFKESLSDMLGALYVDAVMQKNADAINAALANNTYHTYYAPTPGLVSYVIDGYEGTTKDSFTGKELDDSGLDAINLKGRTEVAAGEMAYKLITSDDWSMIIAVDDVLLEKLGDEKVLEVGFEQDNAKSWATVTVMERDHDKYLILDMDDSMERYADQRFININLNLNEKEGLKIPNSAIVEKRFFTIPKGFFMKGSDTKELGVLKKTGRNNVKFIVPTIYYETDDYYYIDNEQFHKGDTIVKGDSSDSYVIGGETAKLKGVYNVNKGYAVFKQIEEMYSSDDYTIIKNGTNYGIAQYDHIALQGDQVKENDIIHP